MTFLASLLLLLLLAAPTPALAYIGPGAGLSLLGALWALVAAIGLAIVFVIAWPVRKLLRRKRANLPVPDQSTAGHDAATPGSPQVSRRS